MSIITKTGDKGQTSLLGGTRVPKTDNRIEAYGTIDELNATIGIALNYVQDENCKKTLNKIQNDLFKIGAEISATGTNYTNYPKINAQDTEKLEQETYKIEAKLPKQTQFILPAGTKATTQLHFARTICRSAERKIIAIEQINPEIIKYVNRLSDLLFIYARQENGKDQPVNYT